VLNKHLHKDITAERFLSDLVVRCEHLGCTWHGSIEQLKSHVKECQYHPDRVPDWVKQTGQAKKDEGISSLRHRLFKDAKTREMLKTAAGGDSSGGSGIFSVDPNGVLLLDDD
jgi:hypothetical protein